MLIKFSFKNFKSFKKENVLDLEASKLKEHDLNVILKSGVDLLYIAAIYGANAAGKTNILEAFSYMKDKVSGVENINDIENTYMFNDEPIRMEIEFVAKNKVIYKYGFESQENVIISEWLHEKRKNKFYPIFNRIDNDVTLKVEGKKQEFNNINEGILFLNLYNKIDSSNEDFTNVLEWFASAKYVSVGTKVNSSAINKILEDEKYKEELVKFITTLENSIVGINVSEDNVISLEHRCEKNEIKLFPLELESKGIIKIINLFEHFTNAFNNGDVIFVDDLDASLHPLLVKNIINLFHNFHTNSKDGQLIYTAQETSNLNKDIFRRDEIWFVEKNKDGISNIYSLADYKINNVKVRNDASYNKDYLAGRYGAIPTFKNKNIIKRKSLI